MAIGAAISLAGLFHEDSQYNFNLNAAIVAADVGKAVTVDSAAANTVKLAGDGDMIIGRLETFEDRVQEGIKIGTVSLAGGMTFPIKDGEAVVTGDRLVGAGAGEVKAANLAKLTDSTGGVTDGTVSDVGGAFNQATLNANFAELTTKLNAALAAAANPWLVVQVDGTDAIAVRV